MIRFDNVAKRYPGGHEALSAVNFHLPQGGMWFLTGQSGAGREVPVRGDDHPV